MKKFLTGSIIALITFTVGITAFENLDPESIIIPNVGVEEVTFCNVYEDLSAKLSEIENERMNNSLADEDDVDYKFIEEPFFNGWYTFDSTKSKGMKEVSMISLSKDNEDEDDKISSHGGVFTTLENYGDQGFFSSVSTQIDGDKVKFRTEKIKGISYNFEGVFFKNKPMGKEGEKLLRGILQKIVKGKKAAEVSGDFAYYEPHCWH